ncbi:hypothetical protein [Microbacterium lacus]|uniref:hypothetical protein n=1 Tax=Microbacterium lacus TaxID=415217 RepID=UPI000C2B9850|nr:hypothetical protein [Microbacterium lacus]
MSPLKPEYARGRQSRTKPVTLAEVHAAADKLESRHRRIYERIMARITGSGRERPAAPGAVDPTLENRAAEVVACEVARRAARDGRQ